MENKQFSHDHPLLEVECTGELCAGCRSDINGLAFGCKGCRFYLHEFCAKLPRKLSHLNPLYEDDPFELEFSPSGPGDESVHCRDCHHRIYEQGFVYVAYSYDGCSDRKIRGMLHVDCALLLMPPYHTHKLVYIWNVKLLSAKCAACGAKFHENECEGINVFACQQCGNAFHRGCLDLPAYIKDQNLHPYQLDSYLDPVPWDYNEWDHYFCDECKKERVDPTKERLQHFSHRHPLVKLECTSELCAAGCWSTINGASFGCERCQFSLHKHCAELPRELYHPSHPSGWLKLGLSRENNIFSCQICAGFDDKQTLIYKCIGGCCSNKNVNLKMHAKCALPEPSLNSSYHKHPLAIIKEKGFLAKCVACCTKFAFESGGTHLYFCQQCGDRFHKECLDMPFQVKRDRHPHNLTLYCQRWLAKPPLLKVWQASICMSRRS
ncbi:hypothetical protein Ancab_021728 [Ancistrocladus abbreviatus]